MTREEIKEKLEGIIIMAMPEVEGTVRNCSEKANLHTDLGLNSVGLLYVIIAIEEFFSIVFDNVNFNDFQTVGDVLDYIERKQA